MEKILRLLIEIGSKDITVILLYIMFIASLFCLLFFLIKYMTEYRVIRDALSRAYSRLSEIEKLRIQQSKEKSLVYGDTEEKGLNHKLDRLITYSGIQNKIKFINTEVLTVSWIIVSALSIIISELSVDNIMYGLVLSITYIALTYIILVFLANQQYNKIHHSVIKFANLIENFSATNNDLISIFEKACLYIEDPLRRHIYDCVINARTSGDRDYALRKLQDSVQNNYFKELIRTLRISSSFEANYSEIIRDGKEALQNTLKYESEKQSIRKNGRIEMLTLGGVGFMCILMSSSISGLKLTELLFETGIVGHILTVYLVICALTVVYVGFIKGMQK